MIYWVTEKKKKNLMKKCKKMLNAISYYDLLGNSKKNKKREVKNAIYIIVKITYYDLLGNSKKT